MYKIGEMLGLVETQVPRSQQRAREHGEQLKPLQEQLGKLATQLPGLKSHLSALIDTSAQQPGLNPSNSNPVLSHLRSLLPSRGTQATGYALVNQAPSLPEPVKHLQKHLPSLTKFANEAKEDRIPRLLEEVQETINEMDKHRSERCASTTLVSDLERRFYQVLYGVKSGFKSYGSPVAHDLTRLLDGGGARAVRLPVEAKPSFQEYRATLVEINKELERLSKLFPDNR